MASRAAFIWQMCFILDDAIYRGRHTIGDAAPIDIDIWYIENTPLGNLTISVGADDCTPILQGLTSNANNGILTLSFSVYK